MATVLKPKAHLKCACVERQTQQFARAGAQWWLNAPSMKLSEFINDHIEAILGEWEAFAATLLPSADGMTIAELRDHAREILHAIALDLETEQTPFSRDRKSRGLAPAVEGAPESAASTHGALRGDSGFTLVQLVSEYRALRASVLKLWADAGDGQGLDATADMMRFNEGIDQALAESVVQFELHTNRTRDIFLAVLGHDLRSPLASIAVAGEYLRRPEARSGDVAEVGERVQRGAATMSIMVDDLLEYARTRLGGSMPVRPQGADLRAVALNSMRDTRASHPDCPLELEAEGSFEGEFDPVKVQQMITNLLTNAAQYRDRHYRVTLSLVGRPDQLVLHVRNRGPVIPENAFKAIFDPMVQLPRDGADAGISRRATSMGLGLFVAREVAEAHGGTIEVSSTEKAGTVFTVTLPRKARAADAPRA